MKKTLLVLSAAALALNLYAFDTELPLPVNGSIKDFTKTTYTITEKFGDYYRSPSSKFIHVFDAAGHEVENTELTNKDLIVDRLTYEYDKSGRLTTTVCYDGENSLSWKLVATYDANGNKTEESEFNASDVLTSKTIWKYNGKQSEEAYYDADGKLLGKSISKVDDQNRKSEICEYNADGSLDEKKTFAYNDAGKLSEIVTFNGAGIQSERIVFRFDANYAITEVQTYNVANKLVKRVIFKYDSNNNVVRTTTYNVADKFGTTVNELIDIKDFSYNYGTGTGKSIVEAAAKTAAPVVNAAANAAASSSDAK